MEIWFRPPQVVRGVLYAAGGFTFAFLALLAWDFDYLYNGYDVDRLVGWAALAALIGLLLTGWFLGVEDSLRRSFGSIQQYITYNRAWRTASYRRASTPVRGGAGCTSAASVVESPGCWLSPFCYLRWCRA